jgi:hypothetical protein
MATIATSFNHVAVVAPRSAFLQGGMARANYVVVASDRALPLTQLRDRLATRDRTLELVSDGGQVRDFVGGAKVLTDDFAPVDQMLALGG